MIEHELRVWLPIGETLAWVMSAATYDEATARSAIQNMVLDGVCRLRAHERRPQVDALFEWSDHDSPDGEVFDAISTEQRPTVLPAATVLDLRFRWATNELTTHSGRIFINASVEFDKVRQWVTNRILHRPTFEAGKGDSYDWRPLMFELVKRLAKEQNFDAVEIGSLTRAMVEWGLAHVKPLPGSAKPDDGSIHPRTIREKIEATLQALYLAPKKSTAKSQRSKEQIS